MIEKLKVMLDRGAIAPKRAHDEDAGMDLFTMDSFSIDPGKGKKINTGVHVLIPSGFAGVLMSKSGLNVNHDITCTGLIDASYTGAIVVKLYNHGKRTYQFNAGDKISQLIIVPIETPEMEIVDHFPVTDRGDGGFGSTGR